MVDLSQTVADLLRSVARVELEFPKSRAVFPLITLAEISNVTEYAVDAFERVSAVTYQVDVWDLEQNRSRCAQIACAANRVLCGYGFTRIMCRTVRDESGLYRKTMYFQIKVINKGEV